MQRLCSTTETSRKKAPWRCQLKYWLWPERKWSKRKPAPSIYLAPCIRSTTLDLNYKAWKKRSGALDLQQYGEVRRKEKTFLQHALVCSEQRRSVHASTLAVKSQMHRTKLSAVNKTKQKIWDGNHFLESLIVFSSHGPVRTTQRFGIFKNFWFLKKGLKAIFKLWYGQMEHVRKIWKLSVHRTSWPLLFQLHPSQ